MIKAARKDGDIRINWRRAAFAATVAAGVVFGIPLLAGYLTASAATAITGVAVAKAGVLASGFLAGGAVARGGYKAYKHRSFFKLFTRPAAGAAAVWNANSDLLKAQNAAIG